MFSCFIGAIYKVKDAFQTITLFGMMVVQASLKVQGHGIFSQDILTSLILQIIQGGAN
jgi:hypothetical protein